MQSQKSPKPAVDSIIAYISHPCLSISGHDFFLIFFDFFLFSEAAILKMAAILENRKWRAHPLIFVYVSAKFGQDPSNGLSVTRWT